MNARMLLGIVLLVLGAGLLLDQLDVWDFSSVLGTWWPTLLVLIGVVQLLGRSTRPITALLLIAIGGLLQVDRLGIVPLGALIAPIGLILVGVWLLVGRVFRRPPDTPTNSGRLDKFVALGGIEMRVTETFEDGDITAILGGAELDLRGAKMGPKGARLEATAIFGGVEITVPANWRVEVTGPAILGGVENNATPPEDGPVLRIKAFALFGGIEVHN